MSEENEEGEEKTVTAEEAGNQPEESKAVVKIRKENERLEKQLDKKRELLEQQMELEAREKLGGIAEAGKASAMKKETPQEAAKRYINENFENLR